MEVEEVKGNGNGNGRVDEDDGDGGNNRLRGWHHSSRIFRVSRTSGGKDRHSKVWTSKGLRDRRVRLSVTTAIQFYDLQDRLGYDQPSKAVEWLIKAASDSIAELPSLNGYFPDTPKQVRDEKRGSGTELGFDSAEMEDLENEGNYQQNQNQQISLSKSSSTSENSKGSGLSLARSEIRVNRVKARERARERVAKEKVKEYVNPNSQNSSFTELLTGGSNQQNPNTGAGRQWNSPHSTPMDYCGTGIFSGSSSRTHHSSEFSGQINLGNSFSQSMAISPELQQFSFVPDNLIPVSQSVGGDYNLNFTISPRLAGFNRGTLQSNTPSLLPHLQRFPSIDGSNIPFISTTASSVPPVENHHHHHHPHQFPPGFDGRLQLYYGENGRHSNQKGKGKN